MNEYMPYCGIGSQKTPVEVQDQMSFVARVLEDRGFTLRSGGADKADKAFEAGVTRNKEIYIPWNGYNGRHSREHGVFVGWPDDMTSLFAYNMAKSLHPNWGACRSSVRKLHARNMAQLMGHDMLHPSLFVVCYTPNSNGGGGTGQALRGAAWLNIPVFDFGKGIPETLASLSNHVTEILNKGD